MLTPAFELTQNEEFLIVSIQIPYAKVSDVEVHFENFDFVFYSKPYYLRLNLPGQVSWCDEPNMKYNDDKKIFNVHVPKTNYGEVFEGLDLITRLLSTKKNKPSASPLIEVIEGTTLDNDDDDEFNWSIEQIPSELNISEFSLTGHQCGFADSYSFTVFNLKEECSTIFDVKDPEQKSKRTRSKEKNEVESKFFDEDHYIADLYHDEEIQQLLSYHPEWDNLYDKLQKHSLNPDDMITFTNDEKERLRKLPTKEYLLEKPQAKMAFLSLIDIIFAYAYNKRTTLGENTVESGWAINKLSATLSWLEMFSSIPEVALSCIRRSLIYPLFRHFELSLTVLEDVRKIFLLGQKYIIKCLLEIHQLFCESDPRYILNDLYITDYCVWMQTKSCATHKLIPLTEALGKVLLTKGDIGLNLVDIESFAAVAWMAHHSTLESPAASNSDQNKSVATYSDNLCVDLEKLSLKTTKNDDGASISSVNSNTVHNDFYHSCSSCTSDSSDSSSNTFDTDSSDDSDSDCTASSTESDDSNSDSDSNDSHRNLLLKKVNEEKLR